MPTVISARAGGSTVKVNDLSINTLTSDGDIAQVAYAAKAIEKSTPIVACNILNDGTTNACLMIACRNDLDPLCLKTVK